MPSVKLIRKRGAKTELPGEDMKRRQVSLDDKTYRLLRVVGAGNVSRGIRLSAKIAYDHYQRT